VGRAMVVDIAGQGILVAGMGSRVGSRVCDMGGS